MAFGFNSDEYDQKAIAAITLHSEYFDFPNDPGDFGTIGVWVKHKAQGKIPISELVSIAESSPAFELYDLDQKRVLVGGADGESMMYDEKGILDVEEVPLVSAEFLMEQMEKEFPDYVSSLKYAGVYDQCKTNITEMKPKLRRAIEDYVFRGKITKFKVGEYTSDRLIKEWHLSPLDMYWNIAWLMINYEEASKSLMETKEV